MKGLKKAVALGIALAVVSCGIAAMPAVSGTEVSAYYYNDEGKLHAGDFDYVLTESGEVEIARYVGRSSSVTIPAKIDGRKVVSIGRNAFKEKRNVTSVTIPATVESIGVSAFDECISLTSVRIPGSVKTIGVCAFEKCDSLKTVRMCEGVETIGAYAFWICSKLEKVTFPASLKNIDQNAFARCEKLREVTVSCNVGKGAFSECSSLKSVNVKDGCTSIGYGAFQECRSLESVSLSDSIKTIDAACFQSCEMLDNVKLPVDLKTLSAGIFKDCTDLKNVTVGKKIEKIGSNAFSGTAITSFTVPSSVTLIDEGAFKGTKIKSMYITDNVKYINGYAFEDCKELTFVRLPSGLEKIDGNFFSGCERLSTVQIGANVLQIGKYAFRNCTSLKRLDLSNSIEVIDDSAFDGCKCTLGVEAGSYAAKFAEDKKMPFAARFGNATTLTGDDIILGEIAVFRFDAGGGAGGYKYAVSYKKTSDKNYVTLQGYKATDGYIFEPKTKGTYDFCISVKDAKNNVKKKYFTVTVRDPLQNTSTIDKTTVNSGDKVHITGSATDGRGNVQYALLWGHEKGSLNVVKGYRNNNEFDFRFSNEGKYRLVVRAKDGDGTVAEKTFYITVKYILPKNFSTVSESKIRYGESVKFDFKVEGGSSPYYYRITYRKKGVTEWTVLQDYSKRPVQTFKPARVGDYEVVIKLKDGKGNTARKSFDLKVTV